LVPREIEKCLNISAHLRNTKIDGKIKCGLGCKQNTKSQVTGLNKAQEGRESGKCIHKSIFLLLGVTDFKLKCWRHMWVGNFSLSSLVLIPKNSKE
jgi:hypothetical protein